MDPTHHIRSTDGQTQSHTTARTEGIWQNRATSRGKYLACQEIKGTSWRQKGLLNKSSFHDYYSKTESFPLRSVIGQECLLPTSSIVAQVPDRVTRQEKEIKVIKLEIKRSIVYMCYILEIPLRENPCAHKSVRDNCRVLAVYASRLLLEFRICMVPQIPAHSSESQSRSEKYRDRERRDSTALFPCSWRFPCMGFLRGVAEGSSLSLCV